MKLVEPHVQSALRDVGVWLIGVGRYVEELDKARVGRQTVLRRFILRQCLVAREPNDSAVRSGLARKESGGHAGRLLGPLGNLDPAHHPASVIARRAHRGDSPGVPRVVTTAGSLIDGLVQGVVDRAVQELCPRGGEFEILGVDSEVSEALFEGGQICPHGRPCDGSESRRESGGPDSDFVAQSRRGGGANFHGPLGSVQPS